MSMLFEFVVQMGNVLGQFGVVLNGWDWSLMVAVLALYVAMVEMRRNNVPSGRIRKARCSFPQSIDENNCEMYAHFEFVMQNTGVKLISPIVKLEFVSMDGSGRTSIVLTECQEPCGPHTELERTMIAAFEWKSYRFHPGVARMFGELENPGKQRATFRVYSQSYLAYEFRAGSWLDRMKQAWNGIAHRLHWRCRRTIKAKDGRDMLHIPEWLPTFISLEWQLQQFADYLKSRPESR